MGRTAMPTPQEFNEFLSDHFSYTEVDGFCADYFRAVYDDFHGTGIIRSAYIREVVRYCERRNKLNDLAAALQKELPDLYNKKFPPAQAAATPARAHDARRVFVSHSTKDAEFAHRLADGLRNNGFDAWIAPDSIQPGEKWVEAIERGLTESGIFLAVLTPNAVKSKWVKSETQLAIQREHNDQIRIFTLVREACDVGALSQFLTNYQTISFEKGYPFDDLLTALRGTPTQLPTPRPSREEKKIQPPASKPQFPKTIWLHEPLEMQFMRVEAGEFLMGSDRTKDPDAGDDEFPQHKVYLDEYCMGKYPVTNAQYAIFARAKGKFLEISEGKDHYPVINVSWDDANAFCGWLNAAQNIYKVALPTEAQWEKAARGTEGRIYPWGNTPKPNKYLCNFEYNEGGATEVGKYSPHGDSPYGCADMVGNVWEWCADYYGANIYATRKNALVRNPTGQNTGDFRVLRGGAWNYHPFLARCAARGEDLPADHYDYAGFRILVAPVQPL